MKCSDVQELFGDYFDLPEDDLRKACVDEHVRRCPVCREEFELWAESTKLIQTDNIVPDLHTKSSYIATGVMDRIYQSETWRVPVANRIYAIPYRLRRNVTAVIAFCIALFTCSFLYMIFDGNGSEEAQQTKYGFHQAASASGTTTVSLNAHTMPNTTLASAGGGFIEPIKLASIHYTPNYLLALSLLGFTCTLLIMNWLTRTRS